MQKVRNNLCILDFYTFEYQLNWILFVWICSDSLDKAQTLVQNKFQEIRNIDRSGPCFAGQPCTSEHLQVSEQSYLIVMLICSKNEEWLIANSVGCNLNIPFIFLLSWKTECWWCILIYHGNKNSYALVVYYSSFQRFSRSTNVIIFRRYVSNLCSNWIFYLRNDWCSNNG